MQNMKASKDSTLTSIVYSMILLSILVVTVGLLETPDALQVHHATPQMWTPSVCTVLNRITFSQLSRRLWEKNQCSVVPILNDSDPSPMNKVDVPLENCNSYCLGSCQTATREGKLNETFTPDFFVCFRA